MFGATVLVPILTGLSISVTLLCAGVGTLHFHFLAKGKYLHSWDLLSHSLADLRW